MVKRCQTWRDGVGKGRATSRTSATYLNDREAEYLAQPKDGRSPTLPKTPDGKVNVRAIAEAIDLKDTQEKYLYEREVLSSLINLVAEGQGLLPIGWRLTQQAGDKATKERLVRQGQATKAAEQAAVEAQAVHAELHGKLAEAVVEIERLTSKNLRLQVRLDAILCGMFVKVVGAGPELSHHADIYVGHGKRPNCLR